MPATDFPEVVYSDGRLMTGDCLKVMASLPEKCVDLVMCSPPYSEARLYLEGGVDLGISRKTEDWCAWMVEVVRASLRVCKSLCAFVVGHGAGARAWDGAPALLCADLIRGGVNLRSPCVYKRNGIMGSGGGDWLRADFEWVVCATDGRMKLPWSDNVAMGHAPKYGAGGAVSHRGRDGVRESDRKRMKALMEGGLSKKQAALRVGAGQKKVANSNSCMRRSGIEGGARVSSGVYVPPEISNPGNVITCSVGGGKIGSEIAHESEAPYPEKLADFFVRSFCPPGGVVMDPFVGSGTTVAVAIKTGRRFLGVDLRPSQIKISQRRVKQARLRKGFGL